MRDTAFHMSENELENLSPEHLAAINRLDDHRPPPLDLSGIHRGEATFDSPPMRRRESAPVPVATTIIRPIPRHIAEILINNARSGTESCPVTAVPYNECESLTITSCFHIFDTEALNRWLTTNDTCPVCRATAENNITV
jgi:hypothetical protein